MKIRKQPFGITLIIAGIIIGFMAFNRHQHKKTFKDLQPIEIEKADHVPFEKITLYYVLASVLITIAGIVLIIDRRKTAIK